MLVLTLIARTTLLSPSAAHRQPPRPSYHLLHPRVSLSVSRGAVPLLALFPPSNTDIPAAMQTPPPPPPCILREYNIQEGRKRKFVQRRERPMAEEAEGVGFVKYGKGCGQEAEKYYEYIAIFRPLTSLWRENVKQAGLDS